MKWRHHDGSLPFICFFPRSINTNTTRDHVLNNNFFVAPLFGITYEIQIYLVMHEHMRDNTLPKKEKKPSHFSYFILFHFFPMLANIRSTRKREKKDRKKMRVLMCPQTRIKHRFVCSMDRPS